MEAAMALNCYLTARSRFAPDEGGDDDLEKTRYCLVGFAVVAYMRPFKKSFDHERATRSVTLDELGMQLDDRQREIHNLIERMRDQLIAHSDFSQKEVIPKSSHAAWLANAPTIMQISAIDHRDFQQLVSLAVSSVSAYMGRLVAEYGDQLML